MIAECTAYDFKSELERKKIRDWLKSISEKVNAHLDPLPTIVSVVSLVSGVIQAIQIDTAAKQSRP